MNIEPLESRIAPASLTFTDVDGDNVVITTTGTGILTLGGNVIVTTLPAAQTQIVTLDLTDTAFQGANVSIVAARDPVNGGDGFINVGSIDAGGRDLGKVLVDGDLGQLFAGSGTDPAGGLTSLKVASLGRFGTSTGAQGLAVNVDGRIAALKVKGDVLETLIFADSIGTVTIGGSLIGGSETDSGKITTSAGGAIGPVKIGGSIQGGGGKHSGAISTTGTLASLAVGGSLLGGAGEDSGTVSSTGAMGSVKIDGNLQGGSGFGSGIISAKDTLTSVTIGGSLLGGTNVSTGTIFSTGALGSVKIGGNIKSGGGIGIGSGSIFGSSTLVSLTVGGSVIGRQQGSAEIQFTGAMGPVKIGGNVEGGGLSPSGRVSTESTLARITIGGSLIGGGGQDCGSISATGSIGPVKIRGDIQGGSAIRTGHIFGWNHHHFAHRRRLAHRYWAGHGRRFHFRRGGAGENRRQS